MSMILGTPTADECIARATELALEQRTRFDNFKKFYRVGDSNTDVLVAFYEEPSEAHYAFLIQDWLVKADALPKPEEPKKQTLIDRIKK